MATSSTGSWTVRCQECGHSWKLVGHWSPYERDAIESRPCPSCGAYALASPEPRPVVKSWRSIDLSTPTIFGA